MDRQSLEIQCDIINKRKFGQLPQHFGTRTIGVDFYQKTHSLDCRGQRNNIFVQQTFAAAEHHSIEQANARFEERDDIDKIKRAFPEYDVWVVAIQTAHVAARKPKDAG